MLIVIETARGNVSAQSGLVAPTADVRNWAKADKALSYTARS